MHSRLGYPQEEMATDGTFVKLERWPSSNKEVQVQQTVSGKDSLPLTVFNSDVAITRNLYLHGGQHAENSLFSISANKSLDNTITYDLQSDNASINIGVGGTAISIGTDNSVFILCTHPGF